MSDVFKIMGDKPVSIIIADAMVITDSKIKKYDRIACSISGGADSDVMLDMCVKLDPEKKIRYVFFDTGIEYEATKKHLDYLEKKYGIEITRIRAKVPVPFGCRKYGVPFLSKKISDNIGRLQRHGFQWEDGTLEELLLKYPRCKSALRWWCNEWGEKSSFNIKNHKYLKEFLMTYPPDFDISADCCKGAKKDTSKQFNKDFKPEVLFIGVRQGENGARSTIYKNCFTPGKDHDNYRPIFWFSDEDKEIYKNCFDVKNSDCYECYGLSRTGCAGCPFGSGFENELRIIKEHEPKLYEAVNKIFGKTYEYTRKYREFKANYRPKEEASNE